MLVDGSPGVLVTLIDAAGYRVNGALFLRGQRLYLMMLGPDRPSGEGAALMRSFLTTVDLDR